LLKAYFNSTNAKIAHLMGHIFKSLTEQSCCVSSKILGFDDRSRIVTGLFSSEEREMTKADKAVLGLSYERAVGKAA